MSHVSIFSMDRFRRYRGAKFFGFSKMAPLRCVFWHHIYHCKFPQEEVHLWSKFHVNRTNSCREMFFSYWPDQALHLSNSDIIMKSPMTTSLTSYSTGGVLDNNEPCFNFFHQAFSETFHQVLRFFQDGTCTTSPMMSYLSFQTPTGGAEVSLSAMVFLGQTTFQSWPPKPAVDSASSIIQSPSLSHLNSDPSAFLQHVQWT